MLEHHLGNQQSAERKKGTQAIPKSGIKSLEGRPKCERPVFRGTQGERKDAMYQGYQQKGEKERKMCFGPKSIVISSKDNLFYVEILEKSQTNPDLKDLSGKVNRIHNRKGISWSS